MAANEIANGIHFQCSFGTGAGNFIVGSRVGVITVLPGGFGSGLYEIVLEQKVTQNLATLESMLCIQATPVIYNTLPPVLPACSVLPNGNVLLTLVDAAGVAADPDAAWSVIGFRYPS